MTKRFAFILCCAIFCASAASAAGKQAAQSCPPDFAAKIPEIIESLSSGAGWNAMPPEKKAELFRENALNALAGKGCSADRAARSYPAQAQLIFSRELELHQSAFAYGQRARAEFYMGGEDNINKALADLEKAINLRNDDDDSPWYRGRAMIYLSLNKYREAVADAGKALKLHPEDMESRRIRADAYAKLDNYAKAADDMAYYFKHVNCPVCAEGASESSACKALAEHNKDVTGCKNLNYFTNKKRRTKSSFR